MHQITAGNVKKLLPKLSSKYEALLMNMIFKNLRKQSISIILCLFPSVILSSCRTAVSRITGGDKRGGRAKRGGKGVCKKLGCVKLTGERRRQS